MYVNFFCLLSSYRYFDLMSPAGSRVRPDDITVYRKHPAGLESDLATDPSTAERAELVDRRLFSPAPARVCWKLDVCGSGIRGPASTSSNDCSAKPTHCSTI